MLYVFRVGKTSSTTVRVSALPGPEFTNQQAFFTGGEMRKVDGQGRYCTEYRQLSP